MSYFKKFTDFCAGVAAFVASLFFIRKYFSFEPRDISPSAPSKLEQFLNPEASKLYTMMIPLILVLLASAVLGRVFKRLPFLCLAISAIPALLVAYLFEKELLYEQHGIFVIAVALHVVGNLAECALRDKEDGRHRLSIAAKLSSAVGMFLCLYVTKYADTPLPEKPEKLLLFKQDILLEMKPLDMEIITKLGWIFFILLAISLLLYNVYFIDAILSVVPLVYSVHAMFSGNLALFPTVFLVASAICTASHIVLCVFENNLSYKEQKALKR